MRSMSVPCAAHAGFLYLCQPEVFFSSSACYGPACDQKIRHYVATTAFAVPSCVLLPGHGLGCSSDQGRNVRRAHSRGCVGHIESSPRSTVGCSVEGRDERQTPTGLIVVRFAATRGRCLVSAPQPKLQCSCLARCLCYPRYAEGRPVVQKLTRWSADPATVPVALSLFLSLYCEAVYRTVIFLALPLLACSCLCSHTFGVGVV